MDNYIEEAAAIEMSPHDRNLIISTGYIYLSPAYWSQTSITTDGGSLWRHDTLESGRRAWAVAFDVGDPNRVYLGGDSAYSNPMFKISTDLGYTWVESHTGLSGSVAAIATVARSPSTLYCGTAQGLYRSSDAGASWSRLGTMTTVQALAIDTIENGILYVGTSAGVFVSTDAGESWGTLNDGLTNTNVLTLKLRTGPGRELFAGTNGGGVFRTVPLGGIGSDGFGTKPSGGALLVSPNPCRGAVNLRLGTAFRGRYNVRIFDAAGRNVMGMESDAGSGAPDPVMDVRQLPEGVYLVRVDAGAASARQKLVVRH